MVRVPDIAARPGERALFHAPRRWQPANWLQESTAYGAAVGLGLLSGLVRFDPDGLVALAAALAGLVGFALYGWIRAWPSEILVTDRRLVHRGGWLVPRSTEVTAQDVDRLRAARDRLRIERASGPPVEVDHPREAWVCGIALAYAAGIAWPRLPTRREAVATYVWQLCFLATGLSIALAVLNPLVAAYNRGAIPIDPGAFAVAAIFLGVVCQAVGAYLGSLPAVVLLRPFLTRAEMAAWIDHSPLFWAPLHSRAEVDQLGLWCRALAAPLYGRAPEVEAGGGRHGR